MQFSRNWLADYVSLPDDVDELARRLTFGGFSVEYVREVGDDVVLDIELTPNRPDAMNHLGLAREISVLCNVPLEAPAALLAEDDRAVDSVAVVEVLEPGLCPRYAARVLEGVTVGPSPDWIRARLEAIGVRPINNVVDVTNYVLWETGQPLHAFDLDRLADSTIVVRRARDGEKLVTLDGETRVLDGEDLVIADKQRSVALAGVMGGLDTEVRASTTRVLLESAHFDRMSVRRTAKRLGLHTDASHRFERGSDPGGCAAALDRAAGLLAEFAGGTVLEGTIDAIDPACLQRGRVEFHPGRLDAFAGLEIDRDSLRRWFDGLGLELEASDGDQWTVHVPTWRRFDLERPEDLYEEAIRILGFENIPASLAVVSAPDGPETAEQRRRRQLRTHLAGQGFVEIIQYSFVSHAADAAFPVLEDGGAPVELLNPLSERYSILRRSMVPGMVECALFNQRRGADAVLQFEIGHVFLAREVESLGLVMGGTPGGPWDGAREVDLFDLKGILDSLIEVFGVALRVVPVDLAGILSGTGGELRDKDGARVGYFGEVSGDAPFRLYVAEVLSEALGTGGEASTVKVPSRFPGISADLTLTHAAGVSWERIVEAVRSQAPEDLSDFRLKDRYAGEGVPDGAVNTTISFHYNASDRSLTQEEINDRQAALTQALEEGLGWGLRDRV